MKGAGVSVQQSGSGEEERGVCNRANLRALPEILPDPDQRVFRDEVIGITARSGNDTVDDRRVPRRMVRSYDDSF